MNVKHEVRTLKRLACFGLGCLLICASSMAFPPAPYHILFGTVRNQWGDPISMAGADVVLESTGGGRVSTSISSDIAPGMNYRLNVSMDAGTAPDLYRPSALKPTFPFLLRVKIGPTIYLPIEMVTPAQIGLPAQSTRLDLTLGEDSDGDGLPDAWERAVIQALGGNLTLNDIRANGDSDGDGISNINEYLAGTYAFDPTDGFSLALAGFTQSASVLEFLAIRGRSYTIETSSDLRTWNAVQFRLSGEAATAPLRGAYIANDVRLLRVEVPFQSGGETNRYFKARVQ